MLDIGVEHMLDSAKKEFKLRSKLPEIIRQKELESGTRIQNKEIAEATGLSRNTITAWLSPEPFSRVETHSAVQLMKWAECSLDELLEIVEVSEN